MLRKYSVLFTGLLIASFTMVSGCRVLIESDGHRRDREKHKNERTEVPSRKVCKPGHGPPDHAPAHGYRRKCEYRYYPSVEVYYSSGAEVYFWKEDGEWKWGAKLPDRIRIEGDGVTVTLETDRPYEKHEKVKEKYGGNERNRGHRKRGRGR